MTRHRVRSAALLLWSVALFLAIDVAILRADESPAACPRAVELLKTGSETVRVVCFGDSLTGVYYHTGGRRAYADMLAIALRKIYPQAKVEPINAGLSGDTTQGALTRIDREVLAHKPHLVTVMFGMNDMTRVPLDEYRGNLVEIISKCRAAGAEVLLCTSNSVAETTGRPPRKLEEFMQAVRDLAREEKLAVADCYQAYQAVRKKDALEWSLMMSDEIHPNMDGHKLLAETIAKTISGQSVSLKDVAPPQPAIPHTLQLLRAGKPIKVYAMPPFDVLIGPALRELQPNAVVEVSAWDVAGQKIAAIEQMAKAEVRTRKPDLVIVAVPADSSEGELRTNEQMQTFHRSYSWVLNWSLSFGHQEWDCIAMAPSLELSELREDQLPINRLIQRLIRAQHLDGPVRKAGDRRPAKQLLQEWLRQQWEYKADRQD